MVDQDQSLDGAEKSAARSEAAIGDFGGSGLSSKVQTISVVVGVVISVLSFNATRQKEAEARTAEAVKPLLELRQATYAEAIRVAAIVSNQGAHTPEEVKEALRAFRDLYVVKLSMVESKEVERSMVALAREVSPELLKFTPAQSAAYDLSHALRDTFVRGYERDLR